MLNATLDDVLAKLQGMPEDAREELTKLAIAHTKDMKVIPNVGQQTKAYFSKADIILYGGAGGGGKSFLALAKAIQQHYRSIIFRREGTQTDGLIANAKTIIGDDARFNGSDDEFNWPDGKSLKFAGLPGPDDWIKHAGRERDLMVYDEAGEFLEKQVASLQAWNRGPEGVHCQILLASNPPRTAEGAWLIKWFAPWLDPSFPNPAQDGELRWAIYVGGETIWTEGPEPVEYNGEIFTPKSRTFIRALLKDNPYRDTDSYRATLQALPDVLRKQMLLGDFEAGAEDDAWQTIPTSWIREAQQRWTPTPPRGVPMCAMGVDVAQGGCFDDLTEILTNEGWKLFVDLTGYEKVLTLNGDVAEWGEITEIHQYPFEGELNVYEPRSGINFAITDNHRLVVKSPKGGNWLISRYDALPRFFNVRRGNTFRGEAYTQKTFTSRKNMPNGGEAVREYAFSYLDWAAFLGWFISEGCAFVEDRPNGRTRVNISQNKGAKYDQIKALLDRMGLRYTEAKSRSGFDISVNVIGNYLVEHCGVHAKNKRVPHEIKEASPEIIESFLETYRLGDGSINGSGVKMYHTSSKQLADDIQELLVKVGRSGRLTTVKKAGSEFSIGDRKVVRKNDVYTVNETKGHDAYVDKSKVRNVPYRGFVYCVSTPLQTIMVRRQGATMWSGNSDHTVLAPRYDGWYPRLLVKPGVETPDGKAVAGYVVQHRRDNAEVVVDLGGGWGGDAYASLKENSISSYGYMGVKPSNARTVDKQLGFTNIRSEAYWRFREALDPSQSQGSPIQLPDDPELVADLCAPTYTITSRGIQVEPKADVVKRLGRSTDRGDAVVMAWWRGMKQQNVEGGWANHGRNRTPKVNLGRVGGANRRR